MNFNINTAEVAVNETVFSKSIEQSVDCDITLPDYCGDIGRILKCFVRPNITNSSLNSQRIVIDGTVIVSLMYVSDGKIQCYEYSSPFSANIDFNCDYAGAILNVSTSPQYVNCRAVNSRRFEVHGAFVINACLNACHKESVVDDADGAGVELLKDTIMACSAIGTQTEDCAINQVVDIGKEKPQIKSILRNTATAVLTETKQISNKVLVKGELRISTLYLSDNDTIEHEQNTLPISQIVNLQGLTQESITDIKLNLISLEISAKASATGEMTLLDINAITAVNVCAYVCMEVPIVTDAYSTAYKSECSKKNVNIDRLVTTTDKSFTHSFSLEIGASVTRVIDMWCDNVTSKAVLKDGKLLYTGKLSVYALTESESGDVQLKQSDTEFEFDSECTSNIKNIKCSPRVNVLSSDYTMGETALEIRAVMSVRAVVFETESMSLIENIELDESSPKQKKNMMFIYYPDENENLWSIARQYNTTVKSISEQNELEDDTVPGGQPILIWCK